MQKIILASSSPRRKEILEKMGLVFDVVPSDFEELLEDDEFSYQKIAELAYNKAKAVLRKIGSKTQKTDSGSCPTPLSRSLILSADTVVVLDGKILGKPEDKKQAIDMLRNLSGKRHFVVTCLCLINPESGNKKLISTTSYVEFEKLSNELIKQYVEKYSPLDKAGAYGIQELPDGFIKSIDGSFENIVGLCPNAVKEVLSELNN